MEENHQHIVRSSLIKIKDIRANWQLWIAGIASAFSVIVLVYMIVPQGNRDVVAIPDLSQNIDYWSSVPHPLSVFFAHTLLIGWLGSLTVTLYMIIRAIFANESRLKRLFVPGLLIISNIVACSTCANALFQTGYERFLRHVDSVEFHEHRYHLTFISQGQAWDIHSEYFMLFKCEVTGNQCSLISEYNSSKEPRFTTDTDEDVLYVEFDNERFPVGA